MYLQYSLAYETCHSQKEKLMIQELMEYLFATGICISFSEC